MTETKWSSCGCPDPITLKHLVILAEFREDNPSGLRCAVTLYFCPLDNCAYKAYLTSAGVTLWESSEELK